MDSENPRKRKERRVGIKLIENRSELNTTFTKRRQGLFKKAKDICEKFEGAQAAVITFSRSGNVYAGGNPQVERVLKRYLADPSSSVARNDGEGSVEKNDVATLTDTENIINLVLGKGQPAWDRALENLGLTELQDIETAVKNMKSKIAALENQIILHD